MGLIFSNISKHYGAVIAIKNAEMSIDNGEVRDILGGNGSGKSTLMRMLAGELSPDSGEVIRSGRVRAALLPQDVPDDLPGSVYDVVAAAAGQDTALLREYHDLSHRIGRANDAGLLKRLEEIQHRIEVSGAWGCHQRVETVITRMGLDENGEFHSLSAGLKRRVFLARALVNDPDLLLLDEPTNHLDISAIIWLEDLLLKYDKTLMFVTHDRAFLQHLATRILEVDRGRVFSFACDYATYLDRRQNILEAQEQQWQEFDRKLAREEQWIRQGIRARRTRNEGRVRALQEMRRKRAARQSQTGVSRLAIQESARSGRIVIDAQAIAFSWGDKKIAGGFSTTIIRGDKVGIIGPNGSGKTTLLKILLGEIRPQQGTVRLGAGVTVAYFDQLRAQLDEERSLRENLASENDRVVVGSTTRHVVGYLQDFLFSPDRIMSPVKTLSGGERNRLLLAKLFMIPSNVLVLDEPTNDLDAETLDLLEEKLVEYRGTILMVSHDRAFLNNVVTSTIVFEGDGNLQEYVGGYDDWVSQKTVASRDGREKEPGSQKGKRERPRKEKQKLSFKEARELDELPKTIETMEGEKARLLATLNSPEFYEKGDLAKVYEASDRLSLLEKELDEAYRRWDELETLAARYGAG
jgi:ATP-binding cassette subfamily F protein uup